MSLSVGEKGPVARLRPKSAREAYSLYVERAIEGANEANGPLSATDAQWTVLDGEVAVPCNPQSATAGLNSLSRSSALGLRQLSGVEGRVLRGRSL